MSISDNAEESTLRMLDRAIKGAAPNGSWVVVISLDGGPEVNILSNVPQDFAVLMLESALQEGDNMTKLASEN